MRAGTARDSPSLTEHASSELRAFWQPHTKHLNFRRPKASRQRPRFDRRAELTDADVDELLPESLPIAELRDHVGKLPLALK